MFVSLILMMRRTDSWTVLSSSSLSPTDLDSSIFTQSHSSDVVILTSACHSFQISDFYLDEDMCASEKSVCCRAKLTLTKGSRRNPTNPSSCGRLTVALCDALAQPDGLCIGAHGEPAQPCLATPCHCQMTLTAKPESRANIALAGRVSHPPRTRAKTWRPFRPVLPARRRRSAHLWL